MFETNGTYLKKYIPGSDEKIVMIPDEITTIGEAAFSDCADLVCVRLGESTKWIRAGAFQNCPQLEMIVFDEGFEDLAGYGSKPPFVNCPKLNTLELPKSIRKVRLDESNVRLVQIPDGVTELPQNIFADSKCLETVILPDSIKKIDTGAFMGCSSIQNVKLPSDLQEIGDMAFINCERLRSLTIPASVKRIGHSCFQGSGIEHVSFPEGIEAIGEDMFSMCKNLRSFVIPNSVTEIHQSAFFGTGLRNIRIPASVKVVGENAFHCCEHLTDITIANSNTKFVKHKEYSYAFPENANLHGEGFNLPGSTNNKKLALILGGLLLMVLLCTPVTTVAVLTIAHFYLKKKHGLGLFDVKGIKDLYFTRPWYERVPIWEGELSDYLIDK